VIALYSCGKSHSQISKFLKPLKILQVFIYGPFKHYKELWRVKDRAWSGRLKNVRDEAAIQMIWEWIC
jgi:hypothetical protein